MNVGAVRNDLLGRNGRLPIFIPVEPHALRDLELIEHALVRHRPPADGEINGNKRRLAIVPINFSMQDARIKREMGEWF